VNLDRFWLTGKLLNNITDPANTCFRLVARYFLQMLHGPLFQKLHWPREGVEYCDEYVDCMSHGSQCLFILLTLTLGGEFSPLPFHPLSPPFPPSVPLRSRPLPCSPVPLQIGPHCSYEVCSGGAHKLPQRVRAKPSCQMYFGAFFGHKSASF